MPTDLGAAILDIQSVKTTEAGGPLGCDTGKKINGRKRHTLVDTDGRVLLVEPHPADVQDRESGAVLLAASRPIYPFVGRVFADGTYDSDRVVNACSATLEIVRKIKKHVGFVVPRRRWIVERFFAWIARNRRLAKELGAQFPSAAAFLYAVYVMLLIRRLARPA